MRDVRELLFFTRDGRQHVEEWISFLLCHSQLMAVVPVFQPGLSLEENVRNLRDAGQIDQTQPGRRQRNWWYQRAYLYSGDDGLLVLFAHEKHRRAFVAHLNAVRVRFNQTGYILWDGGSTVLVTAEGQTELPAFTGSLESLDELTGHLIPGFRTSGQFDRSMSYVQMRDHQTRPRPTSPPSSGPNAPEGGSPE